MKHLETQISSEKKFGIYFSVVFLLVAVYPLLNGEDFHLWALCVSLLFIILAYLKPNTLALPNKLWFKLGMVLGDIVAPVVMGFVYFATVVPVGLIMKSLAKDKLNLDKSADTYWIERDKPVGSMKDQF